MSKPAALSELGPPGIHTVVMARDAALKIKQLSTSLFAERQGRLDQGDFAVTFTDAPTSMLEISAQPQPGEQGRSRQSDTLTVPSELGQASVQLNRHHPNSFDPGQGQRRRKRSVATVSSGYSEHLSDSEWENQPRQDSRQRRRRFTTVTRPLKAVCSGYEPRPAEPQSQSTYSLEPQKKFEHWKVKQIIMKAFEERLIEHSYDREFCHHMSKIIANSIKDQVKSLQFSRYKIISVVCIGQKTGQSVRLASSFVWDSKLDSYAQHFFERGDMYALGVVYGIYCE